MAKEVLLRRGERKELRRIFGVSEPTVIHALKFSTASELARKIRKAAIDRGGVEITYNN